MYTFACYFTYLRHCHFISIEFHCSWDQQLATPSLKNTYDHFQLSWFGILATAVTIVWFAVAHIGKNFGIFAEVAIRHIHPQSHPHHSRIASSWIYWWGSGLTAIVIAAWGSVIGLCSSLRGPKPAHPSHSTRLWDSDRVVSPGWRESD